MQRSPSWLSALAQAAGRILGVVDSGPILPISATHSPCFAGPPSSAGSINGEPVDARLPAAAATPPRMQADKWSSMVEVGGAAASVWLEIDRRLPFTANPLSGAAAGAY